MEFDLAAKAQGYIGHLVLPVMEVQAATGVFGKIPIEQLLQQRDVLRAPGASYQRGNFTFTTDSFTTLEYGAEEPVDDNEAKMYAEYFDAEQVAAARAFNAVLRSYEERVAAAIFDTGTWTPTAVTTEWSTAATATPIDDVEARIQSIYDATGQVANTLVMSWKVYRNLRKCDQVIDRIESAGAGSSSAAANVSIQQLQQVFDVEQILVGGAVKNNAVEGQTASPTQVWDDEYCAVAKVPTSMDIREPGVGRTMHWAADGSSMGGTVESYRDEAHRSNIIRVRHQTDEKILYVEALELLSNITA
jgi:hypothetical protein